MSPGIARRYFWDACDTFSMNFACLVSDEGVKFRKELQAAGKVSHLAGNYRRIERLTEGLPGPFSRCRT